MGARKSSSNSVDVELITVSTETLRQRLNGMYDAMRNNNRFTANAGLFEYLWDLKELALLEGRGSVQVPTTWLDQLEQEFITMRVSHRVGH
jgi:hypothetical protein